MARPKRSPRDERNARILKYGFVAAVGLSAATIALQGGASPLEAATLSLVGLATGVVLLWYFS